MNSRDLTGGSRGNVNGSSRGDLPDANKVSPAAFLPHGLISTPPTAGSVEIWTVQLSANRPVDSGLDQRGNCLSAVPG